ncbi:MAG: lysylphosphatidylglycerol synthase transmembrane domain-containing protein [Chloroflexota bacterium]
MSTQRQQSGQIWIGILISLVSIALILLFIDPIDILTGLQSVQLSFVGLMALGLIVFLILRAIRWQFMLTEGTPWRSVYHIQNIGYMFNMTLPFRIGDVARAMLIGNVPPSTLSGGLSTMVVERLFDMLFVVTLLPFTLTAVASLPTWMQAGAQFFGYASITGILILIIAANQRPFATRTAGSILGRIPKINAAPWVTRLDNFLEGLSSLTNLKSGATLILLSILVWLPVLYTYFIGMRAFGIEPTAVQVGFLFCAAALSVTAPSAPGGIGVFHLGVTGAMLAMGQSNEHATALAVVYHAINLLTMVVMGIIGLSRLNTTFAQVIQSARAFRNREKQ